VECFVVDPLTCFNSTPHGLFAALLSTTVEFTMPVWCSTLVELHSL